MRAIRIAALPVGLAFALLGGSAQANSTPSSSRADLVARVAPAVVSIVALGSSQVNSDGTETGIVPPAPAPIDSRNFRPAPSPLVRTATGGDIVVGAGFLVASSGIVVTNGHVVEGAGEVAVQLSDKTAYPAKVVGADSKRDIAVLRIKVPHALAHLPWGDASRLRVGDAVLLFGDAFGLGPSVSAGMVSALGRDLGVGPFDDFIQLDASLNKGASGGPVIDEAGQVVGMDTAIYSPTGFSVGVGFATPVDQVRQSVEAILRSGPPRYGFLGVGVESLSPDIAASLGLADVRGALIGSIAPGSPAARSELRPADIVQSVNGRAIRSAGDLSRAIALSRPGDWAALEILRSGQRQHLSVAVGDATSVAGAGADAGVGGLSLPSIGATLSTSPPDSHARLAGTRVLAVDTGSASEGIGLTAGDEILSVNQVPVRVAGEVLAQIRAALRHKRTSVLVSVRRGDTEDLALLPIGAEGEAE